jgi:hypothetical protein
VFVVGEVCGERLLFVVVRWRAIWTLEKRVLLAFVVADGVVDVGAVTSGQVFRGRWSSGTFRYV